MPLRIEVEAFFSIAEQTELFLLAVLAGAVLGIVFDAFRALRTVLPVMKKSAFTAVCDALFMIICGLAMYLFSMFFARGELRLYHIIGALLGFVIYILTAGTVIIGIIRAVFGAVYRALDRILRLVLKPFVYLKGKIRTKTYVNFVLNAKMFRLRRKSGEKDLKSEGELVYNDTDKMRKQ